ncbi:hypothetical protein G6F66_015450 [Rhizopus arrhizus]|nr:hypothetical protein G6F66_015450 [Rhizopus arrhizus]
MAHPLRWAAASCTAGPIARLRRGHPVPRRRAAPRARRHRGDGRQLRAGALVSARRGAPRGRIGRACLRQPDVGIAGGGVRRAVPAWRRQI